MNASTERDGFAVLPGLFVFWPPRLPLGLAWARGR